MKLDLSEKTTKIHKAAQEGHTSTVQWLLRQGADVDAKNEYGWTPLVVAAEHGRLDVVVVLLANEADTEARDDPGNTALMIASRRHDVNMVRALLITEQTYTRTASKPLQPST